MSSDLNSETKFGILSSRCNFLAQILKDLKILIFGPHSLFQNCKLISRPLNVLENDVSSTTNFGVLESMGKVTPTNDFSKSGKMGRVSGHRQPQFPPPRQLSWQSAGHKAGLRSDQCGSDSAGSRRSGARYSNLLTGMVCGRWQRPQPVEAGERGGPYSAMMGAFN